MKIGILTYQRAYNYGALLQCYSLKNYLQLDGHIVEVIDYWPQYHEESSKLFSFQRLSEYSFLGKIKFILEFLFGLTRILKRRNGCNRFMKEKLDLATKPKYKNGFEIENFYDLIIYGSDQIWRRQDSPLFKGFDDVYFGVYPQNVKYKISYAASMGEIDLSQEDKNMLINIVNKINKISIREKDLNDELSKLSIDSTLVLDPVFLTNKIEWNSILTEPRKKISTKYILFYHLTYSAEALSLVKMISEKYNLEVYEIRNVVKPFLLGKRYKYQSSSPEEFIFLIENAEFIVSTSFHGTAFSLIFEKQFFITGMGNNSSRSRTLLKLLDIDHRYIEDINNFDFENKINYFRVNSKLNNLKINSINFLQDCLHGIENDL